jgi:hypothetical protein
MTSDPTLAEKSLSKLRQMLGDGQMQLGSSGAHSDNAIVNPIQKAEEQKQRMLLERDRERMSLLKPDAKVEPPTNAVSPKTAHSLAHAAFLESQRKKKLADIARHSKERHDKLTRYITLIVCIVIIICSLLGMAAISRRVIGKWWHGEPDPTPASDKISHSVIFPHANII